MPTITEHCMCIQLISCMYIYNYKYNVYVFTRFKREEHFISHWADCKCGTSSKKASHNGTSLLSTVCVCVLLTSLFLAFAQVNIIIIINLYMPVRLFFLNTIIIIITRTRVLVELKRAREQQELERI